MYEYGRQLEMVGRPSKIKRGFRLVRGIGSNSGKIDGVEICH